MKVVEPDGTPITLHPLACRVETQQDPVFKTVFKQDRYEPRFVVIVMVLGPAYGIKLKVNAGRSHFHQVARIREDPVEMADYYGIHRHFPVREQPYLLQSANSPLGVAQE